MYQSDLLTVPASLAGLPALSLPAGFVGTEPRLPVGLQLVGPALSEGRLLRVAAALEATCDHHAQRPPLAGAGTSR
jgi:aspartyl-tRNA(Asn)/glutamyl-tRNA(Gln) amidotransferase subunit A